MVEENKRFLRGEYYNLLVVVNNLRYACLVLVIFFFQNSWAEEVPVKLDKVEVTGSHIKRVD
ncbi:hypothetical protein KA005_10910, partial [bacterium]|nr:hypothetical protein [bacterium]